jgi:hypothetical protein
MLKALLLGTAFAIAAAVPSPAQNAPTTQPGLTAPSAQPAQPARPALAPPASTTPNAAAARTDGSHLIGLALRNTTNESIGNIEDVIVDADGRVRQVIVGVGGFLGIGQRKVSLRWDQLRFNQDRQGAVVNVTKEQVRAMPEYRQAAAPPASSNTPTMNAPTMNAPTMNAPTTPNRAPPSTIPAPATRSP